MQQKECVTSREVSKRPGAIKALEICAHGVAGRQKSREQLKHDQRRIWAPTPSLRRNLPSFLVEHCRRPVCCRFLRLQYKLVTNSKMSLISIAFHHILYLVALIFLVVRLQLIRFDDSTTAMKIQRCSHVCRDRNQHHHSTTMATISSSNTEERDCLYLSAKFNLTMATSTNEHVAIVQLNLLLGVLFLKISRHVVSCMWLLPSQRQLNN
jgi:hypothetical protein